MAVIAPSTTLTSPSTLSMHGSPTPSSQRSINSASQNGNTQVTSSSQRARNKGPSFRKPQTIVTVKVGEVEDLESFAIYLHLLTHYSPYFAAAFSPPHLEAETKTISFPVVCPNLFGLVTHWLYTQQLKLILQEQAANILPLADLYFLAAKFKITKLENKIMQWMQPIMEGLQGEASKEFFCFVYEKHDVEVAGKEKIEEIGG